MTEVKKHREFWITISEGYNRPPYLDSHRAYECEQKLFDNIHTIEISAVKELEAEIEKLNKLLDKAEGALNNYTPKRKRECLHDDPSWCTPECNDYGAMARRTLAEIKDGRK